jgi:cell division protein FtsZ
MAVNTDLQALRFSCAPTRVHIGDTLTRGLGSGGNPSVGQQAACETQDTLYSQLKGADLVFIAAGMGGGTGTGAAPVVASTARELGALTIAAVTRPFSFEGRRRQRVAEQGIEDLRAAVDTLIIIPNDRLLEAAARSTTVREAFSLADSVLRQGIQGISDVIVHHGLINVDFNDVRAIMTQGGSALMAIGVGHGEQRTVEAVHRALASPLLEIGIEGARGVLFNVTGGEDLGLLEVHEAADIVARAVDPDANIMFGAVIDPDFPPGQVKITIVATGFESGRVAQRRRSFPGLTAQPPAPAAVNPPVAASVPAPAPAAVKPLAALSIVANRARAVGSDDDLSIPPFLRERTR